jgi:mono/diheme cytochrome c family protein
MTTTQRATWAGLAAAVGITLVLVLATMREPARQVASRQVAQERAFVEAMDLYALNCAECHGSRGQGDIEDSASVLDSDYIVAQSDDWLYDVIARGRDNTDMAAFLREAGGALTSEQIESVIALIQVRDWSRTTRRIAEMNLIAPTEIALDQEATATALFEAGIPPDGDWDNTFDPVEPSPTRIWPTLPPPSATPTRIPPTAAPTDTALPQIVIVATDTPALPVIAVQPTAVPSPQVGLPQIAVVPTQSGLPQMAVVPTESGLPQIMVLPTVDASLLAAGGAGYAEHCAACHGARGQGGPDGYPLDVPAVQDQPPDALEAVSFANPAITGHELTLSPDLQAAIIYSLYHLESLPVVEEGR